MKKLQVFHFHGGYAGAEYLAIVDGCEWWWDPGWKKNLNCPDASGGSPLLKKVGDGVEHFYKPHTMEEIPPAVWAAVCIKMMERE